MASEVDICNLALTHIGQKSITNLTDDTQEARVCNLFYSDTRDSLLRSHPWNFAIRRVELALLPTTPAFQFGYEFSLPSDCLRVLFTDSRHDFRVEGRKLLSNSDSVKIEYISRVEDTTQFDYGFIDALWTLLAYRISFNITESNTQSQAIKALSDEHLRVAKSQNGMEGVPYPIEADDWLNSRF